MEISIIAATRRAERGVETNNLRSAGQIPAVVYGHGYKSESITIDRASFERLFSEAGESTLLDLRIAGDADGAKVLVQDVQYDPLTDRMIHVDFRAVRMDEKLEAEVRLEFTGEAPAVKGLGGTLVTNIEHVKVLCLPGALVKSISVDLSSLKTFNDKIRIADLKIPGGMEILAKAQEAIAMVEAPRTDEELAALDTAVNVDTAAVEVLKKKEKDKDGEVENEALKDVVTSSKDTKASKPEKK